MIQSVQGFERPLTLAIASAIALSLSSCSTTSTLSDPVAPIPAASEEEEDLQIVTTFLPITLFTRAVAGDRAEVVQLLPANVGPHDYQAKPTDVQAIATADVVVKNGLELETFLDDLIGNAANNDLLVIDTSTGITPLSMQEDQDHEHGTEYDHDHDHGDPTDQSAADPQVESHDHDHGEFDPHIWLDPQRAIAQVETIRDGLIGLDSAGEADYRANAAAYIEQLQALDQTIAERLAPYADQTFITFHDFAGYFGDRYQLNPVFLVDVPLERPSPDDIRRIVDTTQAENIKVLLTEPQVGSKAFDSIASDLNISVSLFDPVATSDSTSLSPDYYLTVMGQNLERLEAAFNSSSPPP
ncbi:MAG: zinc ABC transporter substrate-binding protein [Leptolyngbyaceae bacterium]|nr:zinc ABC transporter substrate-binding protein [Leptolyngbyaceae bacterium]